jgi:nuclear transport factor 2 (NTF2) superfamily protein
VAVGKGIGNGGMINREFAEDFAREWEKAWNAHDLEEILSHYSEDFQMTSPFIPTAMDEATGTLKDKDKVGEYWLKALDRYPELRFQTQMVLVGQNSIVIRYRPFQNELNREAAEVMIFGDDGKVIESIAFYDEV